MPPISRLLQSNQAARTLYKRVASSCICLVVSIWAISFGAVAARAANECGPLPIGVGPPTITCEPNTVIPATPIAYTTPDGLMMVARDLVIAINPTASNVRAIDLLSGTTGPALSSAAAFFFQGTNLTLVTGNGIPQTSNVNGAPGRFGDGVRVESRGGGSNSLVLEDSSVTTSGWNAIGAYAWQRSFNAAALGDVTLEANRVIVTTSGSGGSHGLQARSDTGLSDVSLSVSDSTLVTLGRGAGIRSMILSNPPTGTPVTTGSVSASVLSLLDPMLIRATENGVVATSNNFGAVNIFLSGNGPGISVETTGSNSNGLLATSSNSQSESAIRVQVDAAQVDLATSGDGSIGILAQHSGNGDVLVNWQAGAGTITTSGNNSSGVFASNAGSVNQVTTARDVQVSMSGDWAITTGGAGSSGIVGFNSAALGDSRTTLEGGSILVSGANAAAVANVITASASTSSIEIELDGTQVTHTGDNGYGISAEHFGAGDIRVDLNGAAIAADGLQSVGVFVRQRGLNATGDAMITLNDDASIVTSNADAFGAWSWVSGSDAAGDAVITINDNVAISTQGNGSIGTLSQQQGGGQAIIQMTGGTIATYGESAHGVFASNSGTGSVEVDISGGRITSGTGQSAGIRTLSLNGSTIDIRAGAVIDSSASGLAIRDGDLNNDGIDETGGSVSVTTAGTVTGDAILGLGDDLFNLVGGDFDGDIYGDDVVASAAAGNDIFNWTGGNWYSSFFGGNGSDTATILAASYDGTHHVLDGGDDVSAADGWIDTATFAGITASANGANIRNWETVTLDNASITLTDGALAVGSDPGTGLFLTNGSVLDAGSNFVLSGNLALASGTVLRAFGSGPGAYAVSGNVANSGLIAMQDGSAGDTLTIGGDYAGGGSFSLDVNPVAGLADNVTVAGAVTGPPIGLFITAVGQSGNVRSNLLLFSAATPLALTDFQLFQVASGAYTFELAAVGSELYLVPTLVPATAVYEAYPSFLLALSAGSTLEQRAGSRCWSGDAPREDGLGPCRGGSRTDGVWARIDGHRFQLDYDGSTTNSRTNADQWRLTAGVDATVYADTDGRLVMGLSGHHSSARGDIRSALGNGSIDTIGTGLGATATYYGSGGFYVDGQYAATWYDTTLVSVGDGRLVDDNSALAQLASGEIGVKLPVADHLTLTPQAQLIYTQLTFDGFEGPNSALVSLRNGASLQGRLGFSLDYREAWYDNDVKDVETRLYALSNIRREMLSGADVEVSGAVLEGGRAAWMGEVGLGAEISWDSLMSSAFVETSAATDLENFGDTYSYRASAGVRINY